MYAGRVACCLLALSMRVARSIKVRKRWDGRTDGRQTVKFRLPLDAASVKMMFKQLTSMTPHIDAAVHVINEEHCSNKN